MNHEAFYRITYGLYVVTSRDGSRINGYVGNTVFQVTAKPARFAILMPEYRLALHSMICLMPGFAQFAPLQRRISLNNPIQSRKYPVTK